MNENTNRGPMAAIESGKGQAQYSTCKRAEQLVSYLYGEASAGEAADFERHARDCNLCRAEMADFSALREAIGEWRAEALGGLLHAGARETGHAPVLDSTVIGPARERRSAIAALREFFALSPAWMRAATAFAAVAFCALAVFAFAHLFGRPSQQEQTVQRAGSQQPGAQVFTERQVKEMLAQARQEMEETRNVAQSDQRPRQTDTTVVPETPKPAKIAQRTGRSASPSSSAMLKSSPARAGGNSISTRERQQLAEVLLPQESKDEERLPRLSDLLGNDSN